MGVRVVQNMTLLAFSQNISNILFDYGRGPHVRGTQRRQLAANQNALASPGQEML